jgi:hypothetical protein
MDDESAHFLLRKTSWLALFSAQLSGYSPLSLVSETSVTKSKILPKLLQFKLCCLPLLWSLISIYLFASPFIFYHVYFKAKLRFIRIFGPTEKFIYDFMIIGMTGVGLILRIHSISKASQISNFFEDNIILLQKFKTCGIPLAKPLKSVQRYILMSFLAQFIPLIIHVICIHLIFPIFVEYPKFKVWTNDIVYNMESGVWVFFSYSLISNNWIILNPSIYATCYQQLTLEIERKYSTLSYLKELEKSKACGRNSSQVLISLEKRVNEYLELIFELDERVEQYNNLFGFMLAGESVLCIGDLMIHSFFACFWISKGYVKVLWDIATPIYLHGKKFLELGIVCGNVRVESQKTMKTLVQFIPIHRLRSSVRKKVYFTLAKATLN